MRCLCECIDTQPSDANAGCHILVIGLEVRRNHPHTLNVTYVGLSIAFLQCSATSTLALQQI